MGDFVVYLRMKKCCRALLAELDRKKAEIRPSSGLLAPGVVLAALGEKPVDSATAELARIGPAGGSAGELEQVLRATCRRLAERHAAEHGEAGEPSEARFWQQLAGGF